ATLCTLALHDALPISPTPRSVEPAPSGGATTSTITSAPNGLLLGTNPGEQLAHAVSAAGTDTLPLDAEIGIRTVTKDCVKRTLRSEEHTSELQSRENL